MKFLIGGTPTSRRLSCPYSCPEDNNKDQDRKEPEDQKEDGVEVIRIKLAHGPAYEVAVIVPVVIVFYRILLSAGSHATAGTTTSVPSSKEVTLHVNSAHHWQSIVGARVLRPPELFACTICLGPWPSRSRYQPRKNCT